MGTKGEKMNLYKQLIFKFRIAMKIMAYFFFSKSRLMNDEAYNKLLFFIMFGRIPDFDNPKTFNEFICARKVRLDEYWLSKYTDKYAVRDYVAQCIGEKHLNEIYGVFRSFDEIPFETLPNQFVLRGTHGSGYNVIVKDKKTFDRQKAKKFVNRFLKENYYYLGREKNYFDIEPRVLCDKFIAGVADGTVPEAKVFCFGGKAKFISYNVVINGHTFSNHYDAEWNKLNFRQGYPGYKNFLEIPNREELIELAEKLSQPFDFVRVDLYNLPDSILFSELTFHSGGGLVPFEPEEFDYRFGEFFKELKNL